MKKIVILGGGISGLSLLWYLKKKTTHAKLTLLEKSTRVGGWIQSLNKEGVLFERGPRSCRSWGYGIETLQLIEELGLQDQVITADPSSKNRFLYLNQSLQKIPSTFLAFLFSPVTRKMLPKICLEWFVHSGTSDDESVHDFFKRRLGSYAVDTFLDPLMSGIYAGDCRQLSAKSCFSQLFQWERQYGSLTKGFLLNLFSAKKASSTDFVQKIQEAGLFSFKKGMETLPIALETHLKEHILLKHEVKHLQFHSSGVNLQLTNGNTLEADQVYSALPAHALAALIRPHHMEAAQELDHIPFSTVAVVSLGYKEKLLSQKGFGYLIPLQEREKILGVVWDSCVFPDQCLGLEQTRLTVMIGGTRMPDFAQQSTSELLDCAMQALSKHLQIHVKPHVTDVYMAHSAIPQYIVGHESKKAAIQKAIHQLSPHFKILGSSFDGVAVNDCIAHSKRTASECSV